MKKYSQEFKDSIVQLIINNNKNYGWSKFLDPQLAKNLTPSNLPNVTYTNLDDIKTIFGNFGLGPKV